MKLIFITLLISVLFVASAQSTQIPINQFVTHGDYLNMKLSPDGKHMSARVRIEGRVVIVFLNTKTMKMVGGIKPNSGDELHSVRWINNNRVVYQFSEKTLFSDQPIPTGELFAMDIDGSKGDFLYGYRAAENKSGTRIAQREASRATPEIISTLVDKKREILIVEYPWSKDGRFYTDNRVKRSVISRLNIYTGKKREVETLPYSGAEPLATETGEVNFIRWINKNNRYEVAYRENQDAPWTTLDIEEAESHVPISLSKDGQKVYFRGRVGEQKYRTIFELDMKTGNYTQLFDGLSADVSDYNWDPELEKPVVGFTYPDKVAYVYADGESATAVQHKRLVDAFPGQHVSIASQSKNLLLVHVYSDVNPGEYYLFNTKTNGADFLWANRSWLDPSMLAPTQTISFEASDGTQVNGYLTLPKNLAKDKKAPMVVMIHGGPHGVRDYWSFDSEVQLFANRGYAVLQVNYRGSGGYGRVFLEAGHREWGGKMIQDIIEGTDYALQNYPIDSSKVCAYGASYGGYAAMMASVRAPDHYKCVVGYVGIYDLNYAYKYSDTMKSLGGEAYLKRVIGTDKAQLDEFSPVNHADKIKAQVMLIHGDKDTRVPVINSETMKARLEAVGKQVPYLNFGKSGHGVYDAKGRETLYTAVVEFLDENIGN